MEEEIVKKLELDNGLVLKILDESKKLVGDRWVVRCTARIDIPTACVKKQENGPDTEKILAALGDTVCFEQKRERNFVGEKEKEAVFDSLCSFFLDTSLSYLAHPEFGTKFILKKYREYLSDYRRIAQK
ncbi:MAG: hypothetical protein AB7S75_10250 [Desulfococcaceae bacterium]